MAMATYESLIEEYNQYLEERKAIGAIAGAAAVAIAGGHYMNKDAKAEPVAAAQNGSDPIWTTGDWFDPNTPDGAIDTPADHPDEVRPNASSNEKASKKSAINYTRTDLDVLSQTIWGEARGEGVQGMRAVAHVIMNRANHPSRWKDTIRGVSKEKAQFSCWNPDDDNRKKMAKMLEFYNYLARKPDGWQNWLKRFKQSPDYPEFIKYLEARRVAAAVLQGQSSDPTGGALFYHTGAVSPTWARGQRVIARIGSHQFYRTDRKA